MPNKMPSIHKNTASIGDRFSSLTAIGKSFRTRLGAKYHFLVVCQCDCGAICCHVVRKLKTGNAKSCGCKPNMGPFRHGYARHPLYETWKGIIDRCYRPGSRGYEYYGGRGIQVCDEWKDDLVAFITWALANSWQRGLQIDRIDNNGHYSPGNCRIVTASANCRNRRSNTLLTAFGETKPAIAWSEDSRCACSYRAIITRTLMGWDAERAITTPGGRIRVAS